MLSLPREKMLTGRYTRKFLPTDNKIERENNKTFGHKKMEGFWVNAEPCCASIFCWRNLNGSLLYRYEQMIQKFKTLQATAWFLWLQWSFLENITEEMDWKLSFICIVVLSTLKHFPFFTIHIWWISCVFLLGEYSRA